MAIAFNKEGSDGVTADYWVCSAIHSYRVGNSEVFRTTVQYDLYLSAEAFAAGKEPVRSSACQIVASEPVPADLSLPEIVAHFDALAVKAPETVEDTEPVAEGETPPEPKLRTIPGGPLALGAIVKA